MRNRHTWDVEAVGDDGSLVVSHPKRGRARLPAAYVARHVELGWAVTGYGNQGDTTDHAICVVESSSSRAGVYVGMTRGRGRNVGLVVDATGLADPEEAFAAVIARPANTRTAIETRDRLGGMPLEQAVPGRSAASAPRSPVPGRPGPAAPRGKDTGLEKESDRLPFGHTADVDADAPEPAVDDKVARAIRTLQRLDGRRPPARARRR